MTFRTAFSIATVAGALVLGSAAQAGANPGTMYGDPAAAAKWWRYQQYDDCTLMATADVIGQMTGSAPSERAIIHVAQKTPSTVHPGSIYVKPPDGHDADSGLGTDPSDVPTLLAHYGIDAKASENPSLAALERSLGDGHKVIVSVNGEMIWDQPVETTDEKGNPESDHTVVVTGIETGNDAANDTVHLNDSGSSDGRDEQIPLAVFVKAWATSENFMVVTTGTGE
jgi:Peptidase_C39 like family